jgi:hypothetical protein
MQPVLQSAELSQAPQAHYASLGEDFHVDCGLFIPTVPHRLFSLSPDEAWSFSFTPYFLFLLMEGLLLRRLKQLPAPGLSLKVLLNPEEGELERYTKDIGYPHKVRMATETAWTFDGVYARVAKTLQLYHSYPLNEFMWHSLIVIQHQKEEKQCKVSIYGAHFLG